MDHVSGLRGRYDSDALKSSDLMSRPSDPRCSSSQCDSPPTKLIKWGSRRVPKRGKNGRTHNFRAVPVDRGWGKGTQVVLSWCKRAGSLLTMAATSLAAFMDKNPPMLGFASGRHQNGAADWIWARPAPSAWAQELCWPFPPEGCRREWCADGSSL